ncbi:MAG: hypothetical protein JRI68_11355 [Deltaproteobacteria bacterium]|nr:hypothetical protein [Deltaproteobacteria bacterium]
MTTHNLRAPFWAGLLSLLTLTAACRPSGCDPDSDEPYEPAAGSGGSDGAAPGGGDAAAAPETIHYAVFQAPEREVAKGVVQYAVSASGLFVLDGDGVLRSYALGTFDRLKELVLPAPDAGPVAPGRPGKAMVVAAALQGDVVALGYGSGDVGLYDQATLASRGTLAGKPPLYGLGLSGDGKRLVTLSRVAVLWDVAAGREQGRLEVSGLRSNRFPQVQLSRDGRRVAVASLERDEGAAAGKANQTQTAGRGIVVLWDAPGATRRSVPKASEASDFALSQAGTQVITGDYADGYDLHDAATGAELGQVRQVALASVALSPDGATVAVGDTDGNLWLVDRKAPDGVRKKVLRKGGQLTNSSYGAAGQWLFAMQGATLHAIDTSKLTPVK